MVRWASGVTRMRQRAVDGPVGRRRARRSRRRRPGCRGRRPRPAGRRGPADEGRPCRRRRRRRPRCCRRPARGLDRRAPCRRRAGGPRSLVDELHRALDHPVSVEEGVVGVGEHVDDGVADGDHVERSCHSSEVASERSAGRRRAPPWQSVVRRVERPAQPDVADPRRAPDDDRPVPPARARSCRALRPDARARPRRRHLRRHVRHRRRGRRAHARRSCCNAIELEIDDGLGRGRRRPRIDATRHRASTRRPSGSTSTFAEPLPAGPGRRSTPLHRRPQRQAQRLLPVDLHRRRRRRAGHRHHPVRGHRRPPGLPVLGRARLQGRLRASPSWSPTTCSRCRTRPRSAAPRATTARSRGPLRRHDEDVDLPGGVHRRPARGHRARSTSTARRCASSYPPGKGHLTGLRARGRRRSACASSPTTTASPTRATSSTWSPCPTSPSAPWRTSAASPSARSLLLVDPDAGDPARAAERRRRDRPRAGPHVVRRPRHHEVVERHLAQRGVRHVHGDASPPTPSAPSGSGGSRFGLARTAAFDTDALQHHPADRVRGRLAGRRRGHVRRPHLREGRRRRPHARAVPRARTRSATASAATSTAHQYAQHRDHRPVGRHRGGHRRAGAADHGHAGSSRAATRLSTSTSTDDGDRRAAPGALRATGDAARATAGAGTMPVRSCGAGTAGRRRRIERVLLDGDAVDVDLGGAGRLGAAPTPRAPASTGSAYDAEPAHRAGRRAPGRARRPSSATAWSTTSGRRCWAGRPARRLPRRSSGPFADETDLVGVAADRRQPRLARPARRRRRPGPPARARPALVARALDRLGDRRSTARSTDDPELRACCSRALGDLGDDPTRGPGPRAARRRPIDGRPRSTRAARRRDRRDRGRHGDAADFDDFLGRCRTAGQPPGGAALPLRAGRLPGPDAVRPTARPDAHRRGPHPERAVPAPPGAGATATHGALAWDFVRDHWDELNERFPSNSIARGCSSGIRSSDRPDVGRRRLRVLRDAPPVPQGDKQLAQHLERCG